ncbi:hypothetical protein [Streptomyces sp. NRRL S-350]|uniref:hypothetical protein n=1 Tax=Streptomyces sp. NRRL S-350 TaxID=1463902 RepID=UPI00068B42DB|nr:hypothetical protein [Streptomyces sp. NRRL S-350]
MTNPPPLLAEDRPEYERLLAEALRDRTVLTALRARGALTTDQLRIRALRDADGVNAPAAAEYAHYTRLRENLRTTPPPPPGTEPSAPGLLTQLRSANGGAGLLPVLTVLTPILAWAAALFLLLVGYLLRATAPDLALARSLVTAGWVALAAGVAAMAIGIVGLLLTAIRDGTAAPAGTDPELAAELAAARTEWRTALRERGLLPYLHSALPPVDGAGAGTGSGPGTDSGPSTDSTEDPHSAEDPASGEAPHSGGSPDFSSPGYTSPSFTSPGPGPDGLTGAEGRTSRPTAFTTPDFTGPGYTPPAFTGPDDVG